MRTNGLDIALSDKSFVGKFWEWINNHQDKEYISLWHNLVHKCRNKFCTNCCIIIISLSPDLIFNWAVSIFALHLSQCTAMIRSSSCNKSEAILLKQIVMYLITWGDKLPLLLLIMSILNWYVQTFPKISFLLFSPRLTFWDCWKMATCLFTRP